MFPTVVSAFLIVGVLGDGVPAQRSGEAILKKVEAQFASVQDYTVTLDVTADVERMNVPPMHVQMYYKHPDKFHFESTQFALLPREGLAFNVARILSRFSVEEVKEGETRTSVHLVLRPKSEAARVGKLEITIDTTLWKPTFVRSLMIGGRTMTARFQYERYDGFVMPSLLTVEFTSPPADTTDTPITMPGAIPRTPLPRNGTVTIRYADYKINIGLSDDVFEKKE
jgi:outer membrane lipoprotein-sorting protein